MNIENGFISVKVKTDGELDENGNPVRQSDVFEDPIPCNIKINEKNNLGKQNGSTFTVASYVVLIDMQPFQAGRIRLMQDDRDLGEFSVLMTEYLHSQSTVKIIVV